MSAGNATDAFHIALVSDPSEVTPIITAICDSLSAFGHDVRFKVGGFGQARWPVDVRVDLAVVVERSRRALEPEKHARGGLGLLREQTIDAHTLIDMLEVLGKRFAEIATRSSLATRRPPENVC